VLDEMLVKLGEMVLRLPSPEVTKSGEERHALARSVRQYAVCAATSDDPRVLRLKAELEDAEASIAAGCQQIILDSRRNPGVPFTADERSTSMRPQRWHITARVGASCTYPTP
jgi:hypothetical protein